jgi:flagellar assembly protein FliH
MKLSPKILSKSASEQFETWNPTELGVEVPNLVIGTQKEQFLAIFGLEIEGGRKPQELERSATLLSGGVVQSFTAWQPGEINSHPQQIRKAEWTFLELPETPLQDLAAPEPFQFESLDDSVPDEKADFEKEAALILEQARLQADELILAAQAEADQILFQAQEEIDEQKKAGYQQGLEQSQLELNQTLQAVRKLVEAVQTWKTELISQGEPILIVMVREIAQKMFGEGLELDPNLFQANLNRILESAHGLGNLNIFLNPRDAKTLDPAWSEYQMLISGDRVKIIPSGKIARGGCFVKGEMGVVDGRVETQLSAILKTFDEAEPFAE